MRIGFIGLGNMGGPMALNELKAGHTMVVNEIRRDMAAPHLRQGAAWAETPKAVAEQSELIHLAARSTGGGGGGPGGTWHHRGGGARDHLCRSVDQLGDADPTHSRNFP
jgi:hypothetical protein